MKVLIANSSDRKIVVAEDGSFIHLFNKKTGYTVTSDIHGNDVEISPIGPLLADIEISSANPQDVERTSDDVIVTDGGCTGKLCKSYCYKSNVANKTIHMSADFFENILKKFDTQCVDQIALGVCNVEAHPEINLILDKCRSYNIIPNITINGEDISDNTVEMLVGKCGAIAVSINEGNYEKALKLARKLNQSGCKQVNLHVVFAHEFSDFIRNLITDVGLSFNKYINAIILLAYKSPCKSNFTPLRYSDFLRVMGCASSFNVQIGIDSCLCPTYERYAQNFKDFKEIIQYVSRCESLMESIYINVFGDVYPCSFLECKQHKIGNIIDYESVIDLWFSDKAEQWRRILKDNNRECPQYTIVNDIVEPQKCMID